MIPVRADDHLLQRRHTTDQQWGRFVSGSNRFREDILRPDIVSSWKRCSSQVSPQTAAHAPADDDYTTSHRWKDSPLRLAAIQERDQIMQLAREGSLVAALADTRGHLLWTFASQHMRSLAESVNFVAGGHWAEETAGTNAVGLSLKLRSATTVFSSEHYLPFVHDWVCYAAPIVHPRTGQVVGVLDISSTWNHHTPLGQAAVCELARSISQRLPDGLPRAELEIQALGLPTVTFRGEKQHVSQRQLEILCLLALNPQGLTLEAFHADLYGDTPVSLSTLKAELSHLRRMLDGQIGSRPYRLLVPVWTDFVSIWSSLRAGQVEEACSLYRGPFLPQSVSPALEEWRHCVDAVMTRTLDSCGDFAVLMDRMCQGSTGSELVRDRLAALME